MESHPILALRCDPGLREAALRHTTVALGGYFYVVDFGPGVRPQGHHVGANGVCSCHLAGRCPAVDVVHAYLEAGGERVPEPPPGYYPVIPHQCPLCCAPVVYDPGLSSRQRGAGWRCTAEGAAHYWQSQFQALARRFAGQPWLFPPVVVRDGEQIKAWQGVQPGDQVLYPGIRRAEIAG